jgi:transcriptional regulator with XRE-family HTH domain
MNDTLGQIVDRAMKQRGLKGYELAAKIGKQTSFVSRLINDDIKETLTPADMEAIERVLGIPQPVMLRILGYGIPEGPPPTYVDNRLGPTDRPGAGRHPRDC